MTTAAVFGKKNCAISILENMAALSIMINLIMFTTLLGIIKLVKHEFYFVFREIDRDGDGRVTYRDFEFMMKYHNT